METGFSLEENHVTARLPLIFTSAGRDIGFHMAIPDNTRSDILRRFSKLKVWKRGGQRAPHKPLLILLSLRRITAGSERLVRFADIERKLEKLPRDFGPHRRSYHPEFPFWYIQSGGLWEIPRVERLRNEKSFS